MATQSAPAATDLYMELVREFPLRPISDDARHAGAIAVLDRLSDRGELTPEEFDYFLVLGMIVKEYEDSIYEHPEYPPVERLKYLMGEHDLTQARLSRETGIPVQTLSDVVRGKRNISPKVRRKLAEWFGIPPSFFA
jgi:HTH-type transcriptional regulator/antitoxin HigA